MHITSIIKKEWVYYHWNIYKIKFLTTVANCWHTSMNCLWDILWTALLFQTYMYSPAVAILQILILLYLLVTKFKDMLNIPRKKIVLLKIAKLKWLKKPNFSKIAEFKCHKMCPPQYCEKKHVKKISCNEVKQ